MLLTVEEDVFETSDHHPVFVLLGLVADGRYDWWLDTDASVAAEQFVAANAPNTQQYAELVTKTAEASAYPAPASPRRLPVTAGDLRALVHDLDLPAVVVVEDSANDGRFIRVLAEAFGQESILRALDENWLIMDHAGGTGRMRNRVTEACSRFLAVVRVVALLDSDRDYPGQVKPEHAKVKELQALGADDVQMWTGRELENYLPVVVWSHHFRDAGSARGRKVAALRMMSPQQRGYLDLKKGIGANPHPVRGALFASLPSEVQDEWKDGFAPGRRSRMPTPLLPMQLRLTAADFDELGPDAVDELKRLLTMITRIL